MAKTTPGQQKKVAKVMHEFKDGVLESSSGHKVEKREQAVAIALSEAGASNRPPKKAARKPARKT